MWHYKSVIVLFQIVLRLLTDLITRTALALRRPRAIAAEILVLRRQLALYTERGIKPRRIETVLLRVPRFRHRARRRQTK
jgi:hypothetical protein